MNSFTFKGVTYEVIPNGNHFTVVDEDGFPMVGVKNIGGIYKCPL